MTGKRNSTSAVSKSDPSKLPSTSKGRGAASQPHSTWAIASPHRRRPWGIPDARARVEKRVGRSQPKISGSRGAQALIFRGKTEGWEKEPTTSNP